MSKVCARCKETKPVTDFCRDKRRTDGRHPYCTVCKVADGRRYLSTDEGRAKQRTYQRRATLRKFGLTDEAFTAMLTKQGYTCAICKRPETRKRDGTVSTLCIDHCHTTGNVRALLCDSCNVGLGRFKDSANLLREAASYLERNQ